MPANLFNTSLMGEGGRGMKKKEKKKNPTMMQPFSSPGDVEAATGFQEPAPIRERASALKSRNNSFPLRFWRQTKSHNTSNRP